MAMNEILIAILVFTAILLFIAAINSYIRYRKGRWELGRRIKQLEEGRWFQKQIDLFQSFKGLFLNTIGSMGQILRPKSEKEISYLRRQFLRAGIRNEYAPVIFFGIKALVSVSLVLVFFVTKLSTRIIMPNLYFFLILVILLAVGFYLPNIYLQMKIAARKEKIREGLPDALDLMVVCVEAGTGLDAAIHRVGVEMKITNSVISDEFKLLGMELRAGKQRLEALKNLAMRADLDDLSSLVTLLIQTDKFGTSLGQALRVHSDSMRTKRFQRAEEIAAKLPVKLLFPLILFIFPALFVVIMGPAAIRIYRTLLGAIGGH
jgi:tight adherence protein C